MPERQERILRGIQFGLLAVIAIQLIMLIVRRNPLADLETPVPPKWRREAEITPVDTAGKAPNSGTNRMAVSGTNLTASGTNLAVSGTNLAVSGTNLAVSGTNLAVSGTNLAVSGTNLAVSGTNLAVSGTNLAVSGTNLAVSGTNLAVPGTNLAVSGTNLAVSGTNLTTSATNLAASGTNLAAPGTNSLGASRTPNPFRPGGPSRRPGSPAVPTLPLSPLIQARIDRITQSEMLAPIFHPPPMALLGIAGYDAFIRTPNGQSTLLREGGESDGVKLLRLGTNRVLIEHAGEKKELIIFEGLGSPSLLSK